MDNCITIPDINSSLENLIMVKANVPARIVNPAMYGAQQRNNIDEKRLNIPPDIPSLLANLVCCEFLLMYLMSPVRTPVDIEKANIYIP